MRWIVKSPSSKGRSNNKIQIPLNFQTETGNMYGMKIQNPILRYTFAIIVGIITGVIFVGLVIGVAKFGELLLSCS